MIRKVATGFGKRSCSNKEVERDDDSTRSHRALEAERNLRRQRDVALRQREDHEIRLDLVDEREVERAAVVMGEHRIAEALEEECRTQHVIREGIAEDQEARLRLEIGLDELDRPTPSARRRIPDRRAELMRGPPGEAFGGVAQVAVQREQEGKVARGRR